MLSVPPATTTSASPQRTACAASITALSPEPQTLFTVCAGTDSGSPALMEAWRAGFMPSAGLQDAAQDRPRPPGRAAAPARRTASRTAIAPSSTAETSLNAPPKVPMGVRQAERMTGASLMEPA